MKWAVRSLRFKQRTRCNHHASAHHHSANVVEDEREDSQSARIAQCFGTRKPSVEAPAGRSGGDGSAL